MKTVTLTFEDGEVKFLANPSSDIFIDVFGETRTKRASHVEPDNPALRLVFHFLRLFGDKTRVADWTRHWNCDWRVNTAPVGGPILAGTWHNRQDAIDAEIEFLNQYFLGGRHE